jgi:hypothetical protein
MSRSDVIVPFFCFFEKTSHRDGPGFLVLERMIQEERAAVVTWAAGLQGPKGLVVLALILWDLLAHRKELYCRTQKQF